MRWHWFATMMDMLRIGRGGRQTAWGIWHGYKAGRWLLVGGGIALLTGLSKNCASLQDLAGTGHEQSRKIRRESAERGGNKDRSDQRSAEEEEPNASEWTRTVDR